MLPLSPLFLSLLFFAATVSSRCTVSVLTPFHLTTHNTTLATLNNTLITITNSGSVGLRQPHAAPLTAFFTPDEKLYRHVSPGVVHQGYLKKRSGKRGTGLELAFSLTPPEGAIVQPFQIGCDERGRHILLIQGIEWQACRAPHGKGWTIARGSTDRACRVQIQWLWVDYIPAA